MTRGRGRPAQFTADARQRFLDEVAAGVRLANAARLAGVHHNVPARHARTDAAFAQALDTAKRRGRAARQDAIPHDESRYNHLKCRCGKCRKAATTARAGRRATTDGQVHDLDAGRKSPTSFLLPLLSSETSRTAA
ncbi:hypothetical protein [Streptomyces gardneri]|uniref:hypothetical protein n=1 Tax=Streptomyces gardneri TaxID=66892 RepID=UPI003684082C